MDRRESLKLLALALSATAPGVLTAAGCQWTASDTERAAREAEEARSRGDFSPQFFTDEEYETVRILADLIIPADDRSGSATDAGVPEFMDFIVTDMPDMQEPMRQGLAWLDVYARERFGASFAACSDAERVDLVDAIAWPEDADPALADGVMFFNFFRDLTASGFWTTEAGMADLGYMGNVFVAEWTGAPQSEIERLGLSEAPWKTL